MNLATKFFLLDIPMCFVAGMTVHMFFPGVEAAVAGWLKTTFGSAAAGGAASTTIAATQTAGASAAVTGTSAASAAATSAADVFCHLHGTEMICHPT